MATETKYRVNVAGAAGARQMIDANQYDVDTQCSDAAPSAEESNAEIDRDGYGGCGEWGREPLIRGRAIEGFPRSGVAA